MNKAILFLILCAIILYALLGLPMNEEYWNHFLGIRSKNPPEEEQILYGRSRATTTHIKNNYFSVNDRLMQYELRRSPFDSPYGESQYELILRKP